MRSTSELRALTRISLRDGKLQLRCRFEDREAAKAIPGRQWDTVQKCWVYPIGAYAEILQQFPFAMVDDAVKDAVGEVAAREQTATEIKLAGWQNAVPMEPIPLKTKPYQHQVAAFNIGLTLENAAYFLEMGTGKTLSAIAVAGRRYLRGEVRRLLVICPASVMPVWQKEFEQHAAFLHRVEVLDGLVRKRIEVLAKWRDTNALQVAVLNYEGARSMSDELIGWRPDMMILDEAHRLKSPGSMQSKVLARVGKATRFRLALTGTPVTNSPLDVYGIYRTVEPSIFGTSYVAFRNRYAVMGGFEGRQVIAYRNMDELMKKIHSIAFRCRKDECLDLPDMTDVYRACKLEASAQALYDGMRREAVAELESGQQVTAANVLSKLLRLSQIAGGYLDGQQVSSAKLDLLRDVLDDLDGSKAVIFVRFSDEKRAIEKLLESMKLQYVALDGSTPMKDRGELVQRFQTDPDCSVFVGQIAAAGTGITLHAASTAIFYSCSYSLSDLDQARSRLHRSGQRNPVTNIFLTVKGTVDQKILSALASKRDVATNVVDNWRHLFEEEKDR